MIFFVPYGFFRGVMGLGGCLEGAAVHDTKLLEHQNYQGCLERMTIFIVQL
jgi:hypothetical protein